MHAQYMKLIFIKTTKIAVCTTISQDQLCYKIIEYIFFIANINIIIQNKFLMTIYEPNKNRRKIVYWYKFFL